MRCLNAAMALMAIGVPVSTTARVRSTDVVVPDTAMVGTWTGTAQIFVSWTTQRELPVRLIVHGDGSVSGAVGDARLVRARLKRNRSWLGRALRVKTDYIVVGDLAGPIIAAEGVRRDGVRMPLDWTGATFRGGVHTTGWKAGGKEHMILTASRLELRRSTSTDAGARP